jgi:hypothetical protein
VKAALRVAIALLTCLTIYSRLAITYACSLYLCKAIFNINGIAYFKYSKHGQMKHGSLCLLIFAYSLHLNAQEHDSLKKYYYYINKAELANIKSELSSSALYFDSAFLFNKHSFAIDKYNAGFVNLYCKRYNKADSLFLDLIRLGLSPYHFANSKRKVVQDYLTTNNGKRFIRNAFDATLFDFIDTALRHQLYKMKRDDQKYRLWKDAHSKHKDSIISADAKNGDLLKEIIEKYSGLPGEYVTGIDTFGVFFPMLHLLLFHHSEGNFSQKYDFSDDILKAIKRGAMRSSTGAGLLERANSKYKAGGDLFALCIYDSAGLHNNVGSDFATLRQKNIEYCFGYYFPNKNITLDSINTFREMLLLEPFEDFKTKVYFEVENREANPFIMNRLNLSIYQWIKKSEFEYACKQLMK